MSSSKIGLVKITCHESLHSSHDVQFLHKTAAAAVMLVGPTTLESCYRGYNISLQFLIRMQFIKHFQAEFNPYFRRRIFSSPDFVLSDYWDHFSAKNVCPLSLSFARQTFAFKLFFICFKQAHSLCSQCFLVITKHGPPLKLKFQVRTQCWSQMVFGLSNLYLYNSGMPYAQNCNPTIANVDVF